MKHRNVLTRSRQQEGGRLPASGFTLIELLVVISIIALLISIMLPALSAARNIANSVKCKSNLRQIGIGAHIYAGDYDGKMPGLWSNGVARNALGPAVYQSSTKTAYNAGLLVEDERWESHNYVGNVDFLFCPTQTAMPNRQEGELATYGVGSGYTEKNSIGYVWYYLPKGGHADSRYYKYGGNDTVDQPGGRIVTVDFGWAPWRNNASLRWTPSHEDHVNQLYLGGHVEARPLVEIDQATNHLAFLQLVNQE